MDEDLAVAFNDVDFCIRVRERGYRNLWTPFAEVIHHESASRGLVILAVPDKRYCFDFFQPITTVGEFLAAHAEKRVRHSPRLAYDYFAYSVADGDQIAFGHQKRGPLRFIHSLAEAKETFGNIITRADYVDLHAWRFTPASFQLSILELACLGELDWRVERITRPYGFEFYVWLRTGAQPKSRRWHRSKYHRP